MVPRRVLLFQGRDTASFSSQPEGGHPVSHIVHIQTEVRDPVAIRAACERLQLPEPVYGTAQLFSSPATGWQVRLPEWQYPVVCDVHSSRIAYDNFEGRWGRRQELDRFLQGYVVEKAKIEARRQNYTVSEQAVADGSIKLTIHTGGHF